MVFCLFALACINADKVCTHDEVAMLTSALEQGSCLVPAWDIAALVLWIIADWNMT
jgi:hypothetical protein